MDSIRLVDPRGGEWLVEVPSTARQRMRGLLGRGAAPPFTGMLFRNCRTIHTLFMRFPLEVVFLDRTLRIIDVQQAEPGRWSVRSSGATHILEVPAGSGLRRGDVLRTP